MKIRFFLILLILVHSIEAYSVDFETANNYFKSKCNSVQVKHKLILIDNTDLINESQEQFIIDNFIKTIAWDSEGDRVSIVSLYDKPVALMEVHSLCAPKPESKINSWIDPVAKIKAENILFRKTLEEVIHKTIIKGKEAGNTLLIEAITEVFRNARYKFNNSVERQFILVSDLYQHSNMLSFFRECSKPKGGARKLRTCPSFDNMVKKNQRLKRYLEVAKPKLKNSDQIKIVYLNVNNRVDRSAEEWWSGYFKLSGLDTKTQLEIIPELQN